ncbi:MAG: AzlD domain-containing protein [Spirochaetes bacterium]|nr:AzlD domain-containing protein [Brevinematales bacterium]MCL1959095.1 AzlD domain-containing protein [Spirochaetota bacterium]
MNELLITAAAVGIVAIMTWITRGLPYLLFKKKNPPQVITYLGAVLPASIMIILVIYCLRNIQFMEYPYGAAELISIVLVVIMQLWRKNFIISVFAGTICYMFLIRTVFPI